MMVIAKKRTFALIFTVVFVALASALIFLITPKNDSFALTMEDIKHCDYDGMVKPSSYDASSSTEGWSSVSSGARIGNDPYKTSGVYAKPGDNGSFQHCYFPGAQKVASHTVTTSHPHTTKIKDASSTTIGVTNSTLEALTNAERDNNHIRAWDPKDGHPELHYPSTDPGTGTQFQLEFDDGPYSYIQNFSRVINWSGYYGGFNIFNDTFDTGESGIRSIGQDGNTFSVGSNGTFRYVGKYTETDKLVAPNHAKITEVDCGTWSCTYTTTENALNTPSCQHKTGEYHKKYMCEINGPPNTHVPLDCLNASTATKYGCTCKGYSWVFKEDPTDPVIKYDDPCYVEHETTCSHGSNKVYDVEVNKDNRNGTAPYESSASVIVPYNYSLSGSITLAEGPVYVGETAKLSKASVTIDPRYNSLTKGTYSTDVPLIRVKIATYVSTDPNGGNIVDGLYTEEAGDGRAIKNDNSKALAPSKSEWPALSGNTVNVYDNFAGRYFCVRLMYYPTNSGSEANYDNVNGNSTWGYTNPSCRVMAKRPNFQVWGGNVFTNGKIKTSRAVKNNGAQIGNYKITGDNGRFKAYGSWGELGVISIGVNEGFASARTISNSGATYSSNTAASQFCKYESLLTFANSSGSGCSAPNYNKSGNFGLGKRNISKSSIIEGIMTFNGAPGNCDGTFSITQGLNKQTMLTPNDTWIYYTYCNNGVTIANSVVGRGVTTGAGGVNREVGTTWIIRSNSNIRIADNITYQDINYTSFNDMPKLFIYAKNIQINCNVNRIDAVLIADGTIDTCADANASDVNDMKRSNRLQINGAIIANRLTLGRTYGARGASWPNEPAEIVNYDTTLLLWGKAKADASESSNLTTTYTRELAPRF